MLHTASCTQHPACCMPRAACCTCATYCARAARRTPDGATRSRPASTRASSTQSPPDGFILQLSIFDQRPHVPSPRICALPSPRRKRHIRRHAENPPSPPSPCRMPSRTACHRAHNPCNHHIPMESRVELPGQSAHERRVGASQNQSARLQWSACSERLRSALRERIHIRRDSALTQPLSHPDQFHTPTHRNTH